MEGRRFHILLNAALAVGLLLTVMAPATLWAADVSGNQPNQNLPVDEAIVQPEVQRRKIEKVAIDTENLEMGLFTGFYSADRYGTTSISGIRVAYHISEDLFFEVTGAQTTLNGLPEETLLQYYTVPDADRNLKYYNINLGYNFLPGEVYFNENWAFNFAFYLMGGVGNTEINAEQRSTLTTGAGMRVLLTDWMAFHINMRDHILRDRYSGIGQEQTIHNLEGFSSITFFF